MVEFEGKRTEGPAPTITVWVQFVDFPIVFTLDSKIGIQRKLFGYENGKIEGIRHGIDWPEYLLEKYNPEKINIIEEIIDSNTGKKRFRYLKEDFSLFNDELAIHVIDKILPILERLNQIEGINNIYINELEEIYEVIERQRNGLYKDRIEKIETGKKIIRSEAKKVFNIDENFCDPGFTSILCNAIDQEQVIEILYKDPKNNQSRVICHPYLIAESNDRWYLMTHIDKSQEKDSVFVLNNRINIDDIICDQGNDNKLVNYYKKAIALIYPSLYEGFGSVPFEAMNYGCPVLSSNSSCLPEVQEDASEKFDPLSTDEIKNKLELILFNEEKRSELIEKGYNLIKKYSWKKCALETQKIYEKIT